MARENIADESGNSARPRSPSWLEMTTYNPNHNRAVLPARRILYDEDSDDDSVAQEKLEAARKVLWQILGVEHARVETVDSKGPVAVDLNSDRDNTQSLSQVSLQLMHQQTKTPNAGLPVGIDLTDQFVKARLARASSMKVGLSNPMKPRLVPLRPQKNGLWGIGTGPSQYTTYLVPPSERKLPPLTTGARLHRAGTTQLHKRSTLPVNSGWSDQTGLKAALMRKTSMKTDPPHRQARAKWR